MSQNLPSVRLIDPVLTTVALGYSNPMFVGGLLFPRVPVNISGGQILQFGKEAFMAYNARRAPGGTTKRIEFGYLGAHYALEEDAIETKVPRENLRDAAVVPGIDLGTRAVNIGMRVISLSLEVEQAGIALNAANFDVNHKIALSGTTKWSNAAANPVSQIDGYKENIRGTVGVYPNKLVLSPQAFVALKNNPFVTARFQYLTAEAITEDMLAGLFNLEKVVVGKAIQSDDLGNFTDVWGNNAFLAYAPDNPGGLEEPSFGYTYTMMGHPLVEPPYWDNGTKSWIYGETMERVPVITAPAAGFLIQTPA
jgi:hypothetical protein